MIEAMSWGGVGVGLDPDSISQWATGDWNASRFDGGEWVGIEVFGVFWGRVLATGLLAFLAGIMMAQTGWARTEVEVSVGTGAESRPGPPPRMNHTSLIGQDKYLAGDEFVIDPGALLRHHQ